MVDLLFNQVKASFSNQLIAGGLGLMIVGAAGALLKSVPTHLKNLFLRYCTIVVDVQSTDPAYRWVMHWLDSHPYGKRSRRVSVKHIRLENWDKVAMLVPARGEHWFFHKGRVLWLTRANDDKASPTDGGGNGPADLSQALIPKESIYIRILGRKRAIINTLVEEARQNFEASSHDRLTVKAFQWSEWHESLKPKRPIESVFFPPDAAGLLDEMRAFISHESWYRAMGIPYRRGYLFHGPPGTGKSSAVEALASVLNLPLCALNLASVGSDQSLEAAISHLNHRGVAILLIEDIDTTRMERAAATDEQKISLGTLLNALDGVHAADNLILILTSNNPASLDPALLRKGRVDRIVEFGMASEDQIAAALTRFFPLSNTADLLVEVAAWERPISMADVQERLKQLVLKTGGAHAE